MTENKITGAFMRLLTMTLAMIMVLGSVIPVATQEASAFKGHRYCKGQHIYIQEVRSSVCRYNHARLYEQFRFYCRRDGRGTSDVYAEYL